MSPSSLDPSRTARLADPSPGDIDPRSLIGLRPTRYPKSGHHPSAGACPPWCWVEQDPTLHQHEITAGDPMRALHHIGEPIAVVASLYRGTPSEDGQHVQTATVEVDLTQVGGAEPVVDVSLRHWPDGRHAQEQRLVLTHEDARELATVLNHLVDLATSSDDRPG